jgi:hypothetical protein
MTIRKGCIPTSSSCILWQGPTISCLEHCSGETIEDVIYHMGELLCTLNEQTCTCPNTLENINCERTDSGLVTFTLFDYLAFLFEDACEATGGLVGIESIAKTVAAIQEDLETLLDLPVCLQYVDKGETVTKLLYSEYILLLAASYCDLLAIVEELSTDVSGIDGRLEIVEQWITDYKEPDILTITSQCASATNPGETVNIDTAFETFEGNYCSYIGVSGSSAEWITALNQTCSGLAAEEQLSNPGDHMDDIATWIGSPTTVANNYNNLWLTICDMRTALKDLLASNAVLPCVLAPVENLVITSYDTTTATIDWEKSSLANIEDALGFIIEVYEWNGGSQGNLITTATVGATTYTYDIISGSIIGDIEYLVKVTAVYSCGSSTALTVLGVLKENTILYKVNLSEVSDSGITTACDDGGGAVNYDYITNTITLDFVDATLGAPAITPSDIDVIIRFTVNHPDYGIFTQHSVITIPSGASTVDYDYISEQTILADDGTCKPVTKSIVCGVSISNTSAEFGTGIVQC